MQRKKQKIINLRLLNGFFHSKYNLWIIGISTVLISIIYIHFLSFKPIIIFPSDNDLQFELYADKANDGNSEIIKQSISESSIDFHFILRDGFLNPYVGLIIRPNPQDGIINLLNYNQIHLDIEGQDVESIALYIFTRNNLKNPTNPELCFQSTLEISSERNQYKILLDQFRMPDWWRDFNSISRDEKIQLDLKEVLHINIGTTYTPKLGTERSLRIHSIRFERNNSPLLKVLLLAELLVFLLLIIIHGIRGYSKQIPAPLTIAYKPLTIDNENHQPSGFMKYINSHFHDQGLNLEQVTAETGINQRRIAQSIQDTYNCNFKTYINQIRITEAKRLLKESSLNMGEISYSVGFNNQSHFNRVFKNFTGNSPTEFRDHKI